MLGNVFRLNGLLTGICGNNLSVCRKTTQIHKQRKEVLMDNNRQNSREFMIKHVARNLFPKYVVLTTNAVTILQQKGKQGHNNSLSFSSPCCQSK